MKHTLLHDWHLSQDAHMGEFGGYRMPLWYKTGPIQEHRAVITHAGLFDTSHMAELLIEGPESRKLIQLALTKDLDRCLGKAQRPLSVGRATYGFLLQENGHVLDDAIVMMESEERYLLVVNAAMGAPVATHLLALARDLDVAVSDLTDKLSKFDLQGPAAPAIIRKILADASVLDDGMPYFSFLGHYDYEEHRIRSRQGIPFLLSRTGYTGEMGFEIFVRPADFPALWNEILEAGGDDGVLPCGLGARDSLRAGACLPLSHQDIGEWPCIRHPWTFALAPSDSEGFSKFFIGDDALLEAEKTDAPYTYLFRGDNGRKINAGNTVHLDDREIGTLLTCATDMAIDLVDGNVLSLSSPDAPEDFTPKGLCCGVVRVNHPLEVGTRLTLRDKRREIPVTIVTDIRPNRTARKKL